MIHLKIRNVSVGKDDNYFVDAFVTGDSTKVNYYLEKMYNDLGVFNTIDFNRLQYKNRMLIMNSSNYLDVCRGILVLASEIDEPVEIEVEKFLFEDDMYEIAERFYKFTRKSL